MNGPGDYEWLRGEGARSASFHWWVWWMLHSSPALGGSSRKHTHARRRGATLILWLWRHQWGCVTQVAAVLIKRGLSWLTKDATGLFQTQASGNISALPVIYCHLCFLGQNLSLLLAIIVSHPLFWKTSCSLFDHTFLPVRWCVIIFQKIKNSLYLILEHCYCWWTEDWCCCYFCCQTDVVQSYLLYRSCHVI